jgi:hypothetical protein
MSKYKVIKPINVGSGFLMDKMGNSVSMQSLTPKVGDIINGTIITTFIFNKNVTGISYPITTGRSDVGGNSIIMIPEDSIQLIDSNSESLERGNLLYLNTILNPKSNTNTINNKVNTGLVGQVSAKIGIPQYLIIGLVIIVVGFGILKYKKVI